MPNATTTEVLQNLKNAYDPKVIFRADLVDALITSSTLKQELSLQEASAIVDHILAKHSVT